MIKYNKYIFILTIIVLIACNPSQKFTNSLGMTFVYIEPGVFMMGDTNGKDNEKPAHEVTISKGFYMQSTEVTVGQFRQFIHESNYKTTAETEDGTYVFLEDGYQKKEDANWRNPYFAQDDNHPVTCISRYDMDAFINWLSEKTGEIYRLPTEAEWEYACRAGSSAKFFWGDSMDSNFCWYKDNAQETTHPVGTKLPNEWGLYDIIGNVMEACADIYNENYYKDSPDKDPQGSAEGNEVVFRGGSWYFDSEYCRCSMRFSAERYVRSPLSGFRIVKCIN